MKTLRLLSLVLAARASLCTLHAQLIDAVDFETGTFDQLQPREGRSADFRVHVENQTPAEGSSSVVDRPHGTGKAFRALVTPRADTKTRAEIRIKSRPQDAETWYGWEIFLPADFALPARGRSGDYFIITQWHRGGATKFKGTPNAFGLSRDGTYTFHFRAGAEAKASLGLRAVKWADDRGKWTQWALHARWSAGSKGFLRLYRNRELVASHDGANWVPEPASAVMWKAGIYTGPSPEARRFPFTSTISGSAKQRARRG